MFSQLGLGELAFGYLSFEFDIGVNELRSSAGDVCFQSFVQALDFSSSFGNPPHLSDAVFDCDKQESDFKHNPARLLQPTPFARREHTIYRLRPEDAAQKVISGHHNRGRD